MSVGGATRILNLSISLNGTFDPSVPQHMLLAAGNCCKIILLLLYHDLK